MFPRSRRRGPPVRSPLGHPRVLSSRQLAGLPSPGQRVGMSPPLLRSSPARTLPEDSVLTQPSRKRVGVVLNAICLTCEPANL